MGGQPEMAVHIGIMTTVIQAEGLGKQYRRGVRVEAGLRHVLEDFVRSPWRALRGARPETFWALKDVSLEVRDGECWADRTEWLRENDAAEIIVADYATHGRLGRDSRRVRSLLEVERGSIQS